MDSLEAAESITLLLRRWGEGDLTARDRVLDLIYREVLGIARSLMRNEGPGHLLGATALAHEAYLRIAEHRQMDWRSRSHFYGAVATAMRRVLVDEARKRLAAKRGAGEALTAADRVASGAHQPDLDVIALYSALDELEHKDPDRARVVQLRYLLGLSIDETAAVMGCSTQAVNRDWHFARAWLARRLRSGSVGVPGN